MLEANTLAHLSSAARLPVAPVNSEGLGCHLEVFPARGMLSVKGDLSDPAFAAAVRSACGCAVPDVRTVSVGEAGSAIWMAPDELMLLVPYAEAAQRLSAFEADLAGKHVTVVDVSDARIFLRLSGSRSAQALAKGSPVDFSNAAFPLYHVRRTRVGQIAAAIIKMNEQEPVFDVMCFRSYAPYLSEWLRVAAQENALNDL